MPLLIFGRIQHTFDKKKETLKVYSLEEYTSVISETFIYFTKQHRQNKDMSTSAKTPNKHNSQNPKSYEEPGTLSDRP